MVPRTPPCGPVVVVGAPHDLCNMRCMITCYNVMIFTLYMLYHANIMLLYMLCFV